MLCFISEKSSKSRTANQAPQCLISKLKHLTPWRDKYRDFQFFWFSFFFPPIFCQFLFKANGPIYSAGAQHGAVNWPICQANSPKFHRIRRTENHRKMYLDSSNFYNFRTIWIPTAFRIILNQFETRTDGTGERINCSLICSEQIVRNRQNLPFRIHNIETDVV